MCFKIFEGKEVKISYEVIDTGHIFSRAVREVAKSEYVRQAGSYIQLGLPYQKPLTY